MKHDYTPCLNCGEPTDGTYCSDGCAKKHNPCPYCEGEGFTYSECSRCMDLPEIDVDCPECSGHETGDWKKQCTYCEGEGVK